MSSVFRDHRVYQFVSFLSAAYLARAISEVLPYRMSQ